MRIAVRARSLVRSERLTGCTCATPLLARPTLSAFASSSHFSTSTSKTSPPARKAPRPAANPFSTRALSQDAKARKPGPAAAYDEQVASGLLQEDEHQRDIVAMLQTMHDELEAYSPAPILPPPGPPPPPTLYQKLFGGAPEKQSIIPPIPEDVPLGLYLHGSVGCGKSFLMDLFYANLPDKFEKSKRRVHFHAFMVDVHQRGHRMRQALTAEQDWIVHAARDLAKEARVLCFDEFQVTDIADAMILRRLMESLMAYGVVAVMTSNRIPDDLYKNGIQREQFVPCIELIKKRFVVECLDSEIDYRKRPRALSKVYMHPITPEHHQEFDKLFEGVSGDAEPVADRSVTVWGRKVRIPLSTKKVAKFTFQQLCGGAHSASDYLAITKEFETIFVTDVPQLGLNTKDMARRFILFIDSAYEAKTKLFILSEPPISQVFSDKKIETDSISDHQRSVMDDLGLSAEAVGASSIFTGEEEIFAFARAVSRITEMGGVQWAQQSKGLEPEKIEAVMKAV